MLIKSPGRNDITLSTKYPRKSDGANILYVIRGGNWTSSKIRNFARRLSSKPNQLIQRRTA
jgi:hypothetical protein